MKNASKERLQERLHVRYIGQTTRKDEGHKMMSVRTNPKSINGNTK